MVHKLLQLLVVHETHVVKVAEDLSLEDHRLRDAPLAATFGEWWMILAIVVDCIPLVLRVGTILALLVASVRLGTLLPLSCEKTVKRLVLSIRDQALILIHAVRALLVGSMVAADFSWHD